MPPWRPCSTGSNPRGWSPATAASWPSSIARDLLPGSPPEAGHSLVDKLYQGEPGLLVLHLLKSHPLDPGQAKEVRAVLDEMIGETAKKKPK